MHSQAQSNGRHQHMPELNSMEHNQRPKARARSNERVWVASRRRRVDSQVYEKLRFIDLWVYEFEQSLQESGFSWFFGGSVDLWGGQKNGNACLGWRWGLGKGIFGASWRGRPGPEGRRQGLIGSGA